MNDKLPNIILQYKRALNRFEKAMSEKETEYVRDSAIKRFEFTFELMWKLLKVYLEDMGKTVYSPRESIREAFQMGLISEDESWIRMLETRNATAHIYSEKMAKGVYLDLPKYIPLFNEVLKRISSD